MGNNRVKEESMAEKPDNKKKPFTGTISIIPGGSKGIGRATAEEIVRQGGSVCIIAREEKALKDTWARLESLRTDPSQFAEIIVADTTQMEVLKPKIDDLIVRRGMPYYLINCVGYAYPQYIEKLTLDDFRKNMDINYYGQLVPTLILLPYFLKQKRGHIANVSSLLGFMSIMGYATYSPSKFAIVGLTEALRSELKPCNIHFSILYPPDTDTPGLAIENQTKPKECAIMSEKAKLMTAEQVARVFVNGILQNRLHITPGESGFARLMYRHFPWLVNWIMDGDYNKARKRLGKA
jgi:3-dehydrosphinganine reductase